MKTGGGDFNADAYKQLREAYGKEQQNQIDDELRGGKLMGQEYGLETGPVDSPWKDKIENWTYPSGKGQYIDEHQGPDEILKIMREAAQERLDAQKEAEPEEKELEEPIAEEVEKEAVEEKEEEVEEVVAEEEEDAGEKEDESGDKDEEPEDESEDSEEEVEEPTDEPEEEEYDAEAVAEQIAALRSEIEGMSFVTQDQEDDES